MLQGTDSKQFFTFWDMDDTLVYWPIENQQELAFIKNPERTLPLLIWMSQATNQHFGILTNRGPKDNGVVDYKIKMLIEDISDFGIVIPSEHILFGGGENGDRMMREYQASKSDVDKICAQFRSLSILEMGTDFSRKADEIQQSYEQYTNIKFEGKNYFLLEFLNDPSRNKANSYCFNNRVCTKADLTVVLVDDNEKIAAAAQKLGNGFCSVQASGVVKVPKENADPKIVREFYRVDYLHDLAERIGFTDYCNSLLNSPEKHTKDGAMMQMAGLLFLWQTSPTDPRLMDRMKKIEAQLNDKECDQVTKILQNIISLNLKIQGHPTEFKVRNVHAQYTAVDPLVEIFILRANRFFLDTVTEQISLIKNKIKGLIPQAVEQPAVPLERSKGSFRMLSKNRNILKPTNPAPIADLSPEIQSVKTYFKQKKKALIERVYSLRTSLEKDIADRANEKYLAITKNSSDIQHSIPRSPSVPGFSLKPTAVSTSGSIPVSKSTGNSRSPSSSESSAASGDTTPPLLFRARSTSLNKDGEPLPRIRTVKSASSFDEIVGDTLDPKKDEKKKNKSGSNKE